MNEIWQSSTYKVVKAMRATGNRAGVIADWKREIKAWVAAQPATPEANALRAWLPLWQARAVYTAAELAPLFPAVAAYFGFMELRLPRSAKRVENRLQFIGLPTLQNADGQDTFVHPMTGRYERFFCCERIHFWSKAVLTQEEFEREFFG